MANLFERTGLVQEDEIMLDISAIEFEKVLKHNLDPLKYRFFEVFSKSKNSYKGIVGQNRFIIQKKRSLFQLRSGLIKISGNYKEENQRTTVSIEINGWNIYMVLLYLIFIIFYAFGYSLIFQNEIQKDSNINLYFAIVLSLHMVLQISAPILAKSKSVKNTKHHLSGVFQDMIINYRYHTKSELV